MLTITNSKNGKKYKVLRFGDIKKGDNYLVINEDKNTIEIAKATDDFPNHYGSFILEKTK